MEFLSAIATNSRLMGSVGLRVAWELSDGRLDQFFLLDAEGLGIADYVGIKNGDPRRLHSETERLMGGLGAERIKLTFAEAVTLIKDYAARNESYGKPLPDNSGDFEFILNMKPAEVDAQEIFFKLCKEIETPVEFINYMVMRFVARDSEAIRYFSDNKDICEMYITKANASLLKNSVKKAGRRGLGYVSRLIYEDKGEYSRCTLGMSMKLVEDRYMIAAITIGTVTRLDEAEAFDEIRREEYIGIYHVDSPDEFRDNFLYEMSHCLKSPFESGIMLTEFRLDNSHVKSPEYLISNDIASIYFITNSGQLVVANYYPQERIDADSRLLNCYREYIMLGDEFIFPASVIYEFALGGCDSFYSFLTKR